MSLADNQGQHPVPWEQRARSFLWKLVLQESQIPLSPNRQEAVHLAALSVPLDIKYIVNDLEQHAEAPYANSPLEVFPRAKNPRHKLERNLATLKTVIRQRPEDFFVVETTCKGGQLALH